MTRAQQSQKFAVFTLRCCQTNAHNTKKGGNIYNAKNCGISIVMEIFLFYFRYGE